eukprot:c4029_g2_i1 orf=61-258(+)
MARDNIVANLKEVGIQPTYIHVCAMLCYIPTLHTWAIKRSYFDVRFHISLFGGSCGGGQNPYLWR